MVQVSIIALDSLGFSSPFLGTFFQYDINIDTAVDMAVFVPFLGDFLSIWHTYDDEKGSMPSMFSSPFLGTFFQ